MSTIRDSSSSSAKRAREMLAFSFVDGAGQCGVRGGFWARMMGLLVEREIKATTAVKMHTCRILGRVYYMFNFVRLYSAVRSRFGKVEVVSLVMVKSFQPHA